MKPRRLVHRGSVLSVAFWMDDTIVGTATIRRRILELLGVDEVRRGPAGLFVKLRAPTWTTCEAAPGIPIVSVQNIFTSCPLDDDELEALNAPRGSLVIARAGEAMVFAPETFVLEDLSTWIDLSDWNETAVKPLGVILSAPLHAAPPRDLDARKEAGIEPLSSEAEALRQALANAGRSAQAVDNPGILSGILASFSAFLSGMAAKLGRRATAPTSTARSTALIARPADPSPSNDWADRLRMTLNSAAARLLVWARLASWIGRRQAEYLAKTFDMFDSGNLDEALRHAIPLGNDSGKAVPIALGLPTPRADLTISTSRGGATSALGLGGNVFEALRSRYRKAVEKLEAQGRIKEAAFVLAELLNASEEAVSFLERHGLYRMAAELAEGRKLDPALIVRQWMLAGDHQRAILIARQTGCFSAAIARLEPGHPEHAAALRVLWANQLADSGAFVAAVQIIWPVQPARNLARDWIERGIELGGVGSLILLATKAHLMPEAFDSVVKAVHRLPQNDDVESIEQWQTFGEAVLSHGPQPTMRILARMCVRALLPVASEREAKPLLDRLAKATDDRVLMADLRGFAPEERRTKKIRFRAVGRTDSGLRRSSNEDGYLLALLENGRITPYAHTIAERNLPANGALMVVVDGMGGGREVSALVNLIFNTLTNHIQPSAGNQDEIGQTLVTAMNAANAAVYQRATQDHTYAGSGATVTAAWLTGDTLWIAQIGDTRAYVYRDHHLVQITQDHTLIRELEESGQALSEDMKEIPRNIITRAMGMSETAKVDIWRTTLRAKDRIFLCSDGIHGMVDESVITKVLSAPNPQSACDLLKAKTYEAGAHDNLAIVIADVLGHESQFSGSVSVKPERVNVEPKEISIAETRVVTRSVADCGATAVFDAAIAGNGRILVALGEAGLLLLSREGKTIAQFNQPAHRLVMSDYGDRALALAGRGDSYRIARVDLNGKRSRHWMDVELQQFATDFDGSTWFVAAKGTAYAVDALEDSFQAVWQLAEPNAIPLAVARSATSVTFHLGHEVWTFALPSFRLSSRRRTDDLTSAMTFGPWVDAKGSTATWLLEEERNVFSPHFRYLANWNKWERLAEGTSVKHDELAVEVHPECTFVAFASPTEHGRAIDVFDMRQKNCCLRVVLDGATRTRMRFQGNKLVLADDRGRVMLVHPQRAQVLAEWRI